MNKQRRKQIELLAERFAIIDNKIAENEEYLYNLRTDFEAIRDEEQEYLDNMPENLQGSDKYDMAESVISELDTLIDGIDDLIQSIENMPNSDDLLAVI